MSAIKPKPRPAQPGKWYLVVVCSKEECEKDIPFTEAPSPEEESSPKSRSVLLACPHCGTKAKYAPALMTRRQAPERT